MKKLFFIIFLLPLVAITWNVGLVYLAILLYVPMWIIKEFKIKNNRIN